MQAQTHPAAFAPGDQREAALLGHPRDRYGHVSWELVCWGMGIPNLYDSWPTPGLRPRPSRLPSGSPPRRTAPRASSRRARPGVGIGGVRRGSGRVPAAGQAKKTSATW
ncbi:MAG TPA: glucokinase [Actinomycetota bacterium]|nr:glucokinase [Actinomycetota bacterium]